MEKIISIQNDGRPIYEHRLSSGEIVTLPDDSCRDFPEAIAHELMGVYSWLRVAGFAQAEVSTKVEETKVGDESEGDEMTEGKPPKDFLESLKEGQKHICSVCDRLFPTDIGMRRHMRVHEQGPNP